MVSSLVKIPLYVCATCGQHFTRMYNARRHNRNIHSNRGEIVRFEEYIVGRVSGKYLPAHPLSYRSKRRSNNKDTIIHESNDNNNDISHRIPNMEIMKNSTFAAESLQRKIHDKNIDFNNSRVGNSLVFQLSWLDYLFEHQKKNKEKLQKQRIKEKIDDIGRRLYDFHPPPEAQRLFSELMAKCNGTTNYASLDIELERYRNALINRYLGITPSQ